jgi:hypothetical protein
MPRQNPIEPSLRPRHELDNIVANIELTLISIVQGVALYFLTDNTRVLIAEQRLSSLPYLISGLALILTVWTRSVVHAFTVIRWPLELGHNFFYILVTLIEAVLFTQLNTPRIWYPLGVLSGIVFIVTFAYEQRMYTLRMRDSGGPQGAALLKILEGEHQFSMRVAMPASVILWAICAGLVLYYPATFIDGGWHIALGVVQAAGLVGYLAHVWRFYLSITDRIVAARAEWDSPSAG